MPTRTLAAQVQTYITHQEWTQLTHVIPSMLQQDMFLDAYMLDACITACIHTQTWDVLLTVIQHAHTQRQLDVTRTAHAMDQFNRHRQYQHTLDVMRMIQTDTSPLFAPDFLCYSEAITAATALGHVRDTLRLTTDMFMRNLRHTPHTHTPRDALMYLHTRGGCDAQVVHMCDAMLDPTHAWGVMDDDMVRIGLEATQRLVSIQIGY